MKYLLIVLCMLFVACEDVPEVDGNYIIDEIKGGGILTVTDEIVDDYKDVIVDGIVVAKVHKAIIVGCFGVDWCVAINEQNRGIGNTEFNLYSEEGSEDELTGTTYFSTEYYPVYFYHDGNYTSYRILIDIFGGEWPGNRVVWCNNYPERCRGE